MLALLKRLRRPPRGRAAELGRLADLPGYEGEAPGAAHTVVEAPDVPLSALWPEARAEIGRDFESPDGRIAIIKDVLFDPRSNVLVTPDRRVVAESLSTTFEASRADRALIEGDAIRRLDGFLTTIRSRHNDHYHTLIDNIPRLHVLAQPPASDIERIELVVSSALSPWEAYLIERLKPANLFVKEVGAEALLSVQRFVFPTFTGRRFAPRLNEDFRRMLRDRVVPRPTGEPSRYILIERRPRRRAWRRKGKRVILNQAELLWALKPYGFEPYYLESLTVAEQIELFRDAAFVVGAHGAGLANVIFSRSTNVLELCPSPFLVPHYYFLCRGCGHRHDFVAGSQSDRDDNFRVDVAAVVAKVEEMLGATAHLQGAARSQGT